MGQILLDARQHIKIAPIERIDLGTLDGSNGTNRAFGVQRLIEADNDVAAIMAWLANFKGSKTTYENYRKEAERLLLWSAIELRKPISSLTHEDILVYKIFLADPQPAERWVGMNGRRAGRKDPDWRPFAGPLANSSQRQAVTILNTMFCWLVNAQYLAGNPIALSRSRTKDAKTSNPISRYLDDDLWREVKITIDTLPRDTSREREHAFRSRWLYSLLYLCGLRISEVIENTMGNFYRRRDGEGEYRWWISIKGKGNKTRQVPVTAELIVELKRYRQEMALPPLPLPGEDYPLLLPIGGANRTMKRWAVHRIVKSVFEKTADRIKLKGPEAAEDVEKFEKASAHWMRHTAATHMANGKVSLLHVRDNLGHGNISTTNTYLHTGDDARHKETEENHRLDW